MAESRWQVISRWFSRDTVDCVGFYVTAFDFCQFQIMKLIPDSIKKIARGKLYKVIKSCESKNKAKYE